MSISAERILFRDDHFLAVNKLAGELVVKGSGRVDKLPLLDFLRKSYPGLRPLNRLDFETSGIVLFARTKAAFEAAMAAMKERTEEDLSWVKTYRALVAGRMKKDRGEITFRLPARSGKGDVDAKTTYRVLERFANSSVVEAVIETGRHHQIRKHFAKIGHPLVLDQLYGDPKFNRVFTRELHYHRFFLHSCGLTFTHPITQQPVRIEAPLPQAFEAVLAKLRKFSR